MVGLAIVLAALVFWGPLGAWVSRMKRREPGEGYLVAAALGPFGVLLAALLPTRERRERYAPGESQAAILMAMGMMVGGGITAMLAIRAVYDLF
jgi:drug/metabolite transporter (DMT)-like permease